MSGQAGGIIFGSLVMLLIIFGAAMLLLVRRGRGALPPADWAEGATPVPVRGLFSRGGVLGAQSRNSLNPRFAVATDRLRYRIFRTTEWPFAEIGQVDMRKGGFGGVRLLFLAPGNSRVLAVAVADMEVARTVLHRLPRGIPLSVEAATLRDGNPDAATPGLKRYRGPIS